MVNEKRLHALDQIVQSFLKNRSEYARSGSKYNETQLRIDYLNPFFELLDWDVLNTKGLPQHLREVIHEDSVEIDEEEIILQKKPDYAFRVGTERKFFLEAKKPSVNIESDQKSAFQTRRYGWNAGFSISILSNFDKLILYDCLHKPKADDNTRVARIKVYECENYVRDFEEICEQLSRQSVYSGKFDELFPIDIDREGTEPFDKYFLEQISRWRLILSQNIYAQNPGITTGQLNYLVQMTLNRIIFLRVCEDRDLENYKSLQNVDSYEGLKNLFVKADQQYNSGLFNFIEDKLSLNITIRSEILISIFQELYYPDSPYAFSVVEASVLGEIYENFLAKEVRIEDNSISIVEKPEIVASGGVITTPRYIVENIIQRTLPKAIGKRSLKQLSNFTAADIACGSGTFLLSTFEYLMNYYREYYLEDGPEKHADKIYQTYQNQWFLTLEEKQKILTTHIFGVDIDHQAIEVARFSLLLKVIENETPATIKNHLSRNKLKALPDLRNNLIWGNSLVDNTFFDINPSASDSEEVTSKINPMDWAEAFPDVISKGGFDVILGNPPYIRIQNMVHYSPEEAEYYKNQSSPFSCSKSDNFDKYALFIERGLSLLKPNGFLGYIVPHKFFIIKSGKALRKLLASNKSIVEITHFGVNQVFGNRVSTYTCILVISKQEISQFDVQHVTNLSSWRYDGRGITREYNATDICEDPWVFISPQAEKLFSRIDQENLTKLDEIAEIFVGVQTSRDDVYIIQPLEESNSTVSFEDKKEVRWTIEKEILKNCIYDAPLNAFEKVKSNAFIIFPYRIVGNSAQSYTQAEIKKKYPRCWNYLSSHKEDLLKRSVQGFTEDTWFRYGRSQSLIKFNQQENLIWPTLSLEPRYAIDLDNIVFTGGGNGPYYGLKMRQETKISIYYLQALLSHPVIDAIVCARASDFRGGYKSHGKQFIQNLPVRLIDFDNDDEVKLHDDVVEDVKRLIDVTETEEKANIPIQKRSLEKIKNRLRMKIEHAIGFLYNINEDDLLNIPELTYLEENI